MSFVLNHTHDPNTAGSYTSRADYVEDVLPGHLAAEDVRLCNVMAVTNAGLGGADPASIPFAWMTPVLGSGAVTGAHAVEAVEQQAIQAVTWLSRRTDADGRPHPGRLEYSRSAARFVSSLIEDRLGEVLDDRTLIDDDLDLDPADDHPRQSGLSLLAASLLTRAYYQIQSVRHMAMPRAGRGHAVLDDRINAETAEEIRSRFVEPAERALIDARAAFGDDRRADKVFAHALDELGGRRTEISQNSVRVLTEYCWYLVNHSLFPAWADLLWSLFISGRDWPPSDHDRGPRPISINLESASDEVRGLYERQGQRGRSPRPAGDDLGSPPALFQGVADVLRVQAEVRAGRKEAEMPPVASAFVTTFDVELERALASHGRPFVVALPATAAIGGPDGPSLFLWVGYLVDPAAPGGTYEAIVEPRDLFVLSHDLMYNSNRELSDLPHVVHLTGSPLVTLPADAAGQVQTGLETNAADLRQVLGVVGDGTIASVSHAVILDEYAALNQTVNALSRRAAFETRDRLWPGLPLCVTGSVQPRDFTRFWLLLGVQGGDVPVRHAVVTHLVSPNVISPDDVESYPVRNGAAVNRRLSGEAEDLMLWSGLDVIRTPLDDIAADLVHYVDHLRSGDIEPLPSPPGRRCRVGVES